MVRKKGKMIIWPSNIDQSKSRRKGRIVPKRTSVKNPKLSEIADVAQKLGLNPEVEPDKSYPKSWWERSGRITVDKKTKKSEVAKEIAKEIKEMRSHS